MSANEADMEETLRSQLLTLAADFQTATGITPLTVGKRALNDNTFFGRLAERERSFNVRTFDRVVEWMSANWPDGTPWPAEIERPVPAKSEAA